MGVNIKSVAVYRITVISDAEYYGCCLIYVSATTDNIIGLPIDFKCDSCRREAKITVVGLTCCLAMPPNEQETQQLSAVVKVQTLRASHHPHQHHHVICLKTGPHSLFPSEFYTEYDLLLLQVYFLVSSRSSNSCLRLLSRLPVLSIFLSIKCFRRQFSRKISDPVSLPWSHSFPTGFFEILLHFSHDRSN